jgi:hypothetical protein
LSSSGNGGFASKGAGQIVQQHIEGGVEQIPPACHQVLEHRLLVREQPVMAAVKLVDVRQRRIRTQQVRQGAALVPGPVQPPFGPGRDQPVGHQHEQHVIPARSLAAAGKPLVPEPVQLQLFPQRQRQPARPPLPRPAQLQLRQAQPHDRVVRQHPVTAILRKQRQRSRLGSAVLQDLDRLAPRQLLRRVDLAEIQHRTLHDPPTAHAAVLDKAPVAVFLAVLPANRVAQKHGA